MQFFKGQYRIKKGVRAGQSPFQKLWRNSVKVFRGALYSHFQEFSLAEKKLKVKNIVKWTGTAGIESAKKLQTELQKAINGNQEVFLDLSELEDIDLAGIQIILAAHKEAESRQKTFLLKSQIPQAILEYVSGCGISLNSFIEPTTEPQNQDAPEENKNA